MDVGFGPKAGSTKGTRVSKKRTICEVHRQLYDILATQSPELLKVVTPLLEEAFGLGIQMTKTLIDYKCALPKWAKNNVTEVARLRNLRIELERARLDTK